jgi:hypothetical protein
MKIRIKGNTLRLRLTQTEVENVNSGQAIEEKVPFGKGQPTFSYAVSAEGETDKISVSYLDHTIKIRLPRKMAQQWTSTDQVSLEENIDWKDGTSLEILVEKDFQCLHKRPAEDEGDNFPNPAAGHQI